MLFLLLGLFTPFVLVGVAALMFKLVNGNKYRNIENGIVEDTVQQEYDAALMTPEEQKEYAQLLVNLVTDAVANGQNKVTVKYSKKTPPIDPWFVTTLTFQTGRTLLYNDEGDGFTISII